ncbi:MAG TPA: hypothetical protein VEB40_10560 [Flavipsychrobacter sp.]|nr:hypothetical protein [Flavipsychrobacter sp.]
MRYLLTLLALCLIILPARAWNAEAYLLAGSSRIFRDNANRPGMNVGLRATSFGSTFYFNAGADVFLLNSRGRWGMNWPYSYGDHHDMMPAINMGTGLVYRDSSMTVKLGADVGYQLTTSDYDNYLAVTPQLSITFKTKAGGSIGIIGRMNMPLLILGPISTYQPRFTGGGIILRF